MDAKFLRVLHLLKRTHDPKMRTATGPTTTEHKPDGAAGQPAPQPRKVRMHLHRSTNLNTVT